MRSRISTSGYCGNVFIADTRSNKQSNQRGKPLSLATKILVIIVALEHLYFLYLEMFAWTKPKTRKGFGLTEEEAQTTKRLAANQGLYNGFLSAGLVWALCAPPEFGKQLVLFFAGCVTVAGIYGAISVTKRIFFLQSVPALLAIAAALLT